MTVAQLAQRLPRLMYVGDVPVEATVAGPALLYRLLELYPADRLHLAASDLLEPRLDRRLPGVRYSTFHVPAKRGLRTRFCRTVGSGLYLLLKRRLAKLERLAREHRADALLTVAHGYSWPAAARIAKRMRVPLYLIAHDELFGTMHLQPWLRPEVGRAFGKVYRQAAARLCVSPFMVESYRGKYGAPADVLYPSRAASGPKFNAPPERIAREDHAPVFAYAGSVYDSTYGCILARVAELIAPRGGRVVVYSELDRAAARGMGLDLPNIETRPMVPSDRLIHQLREEADVLILPMSFTPGDRPNMEISFPSKLTDYTTAQLPLLVWGPPYCSAVRWAQHNAGVAEVLTTVDTTEAQAAIDRLCEGGHRLRLARRAGEVGNQYFGHSQVASRFFKTLLGETNSDYSLGKQASGSLGDAECCDLLAR